MPFVSLSHLPPQAMEWLWLGHLPFGHTVLLDGDPGIGKSILTLDLCARITTGRPFPDGAAGAAPGNVVILNAEDNARALIHPRLAAAGADIDRVTVWHREPGEPWLQLPGDLSQLDDILGRTHPRLVVLDPLSAFLSPGIHLSIEREARRALDPLTDLAMKHGCVVELIRHLNKGGGQRALYRGLHSIGIVAACRMAWLAGRDPRRPNRFVLAEEKTNLDVPQPSLAYAITRHASGHAVIDWQGQVTWTADDLLGGNTRRDRLRLRACEVLADLLKSGPRPADEVTEAAKQRGVSERTLRRAREDLQVESEFVGTYQQHRYWWLLPGQELPDSVMSPDEKKLRAALRDLDKQWPKRVGDGGEGREVA